MSPDGNQIVFGWNKTGERMVDVWIVDYPNGTPKQILASKDIPRFPRQEDRRTELEKREEQLYDGGFSNFQWSPDSKTIMGSYRGRVWLFDPDGKNLRPLIDTQEQISNPTFSPDGKMIAFIRGGNLFRIELATGMIRQLTFVSGTGGTVDGFTWSPDSKNLAVTWGDSSRFGRHVMMDFTKQRAEVVNISRLWTGDRAINVQLGMVSVDGGLIRFVPRLPRYMWVTDLEWSPDSRWFSIGWVSEDFQEYTLSALYVPQFARIDVVKEKAPSKYITDFRTHFWSRDSSKIYFTTDLLEGKWGNRSLLTVDPLNSKVEKIYAKDHDIAAAGRPRESDRIFLVTQKRSGLKTEITILEPNGKETEHIVFEDGVNTPTGFDSASLPLISHDGTKVATLANKRTLNSELYALEPTQRRITTSQLPEFSKIAWADHTPVSFPGPDGRTIHGVLITKPGLDKTKKHPAFISSMYANSGKMSWGGYFENYAAMELGMVVLQVDFRASWGYGGEFNAGYHKSMGVIDSDEAVKAHEYLVGLGYVRPDRVGVWGWSYGGYLTCMIMLTRPGVFDTGVAVASVTDWRQYNEWYVRRRLGLPSEDPEVFVKTSPVHHAKGLQGNLFLVHGMLDDNVLYQDVAQLKQKLIESC